MMFVNDIDHPSGYVSGCQKRTDLCGSEFPVYERELELIPREAWGDLTTEAMGLGVLTSRIFDQGREGSCASNATAQAFEIA